MKLKEIIENTVQTDWKDLLLTLDTGSLDKFLTQEKEMFEDILEIYPPEDLIYNCFNQFDIKNMKVCIIGQDCYHQPCEAMGLCFGVPDGTKIPPSLRNIYKEISSDFDIETKHRNGNLTYLAKQGILLLNSALTVRQNNPNSHQKQWTPYTDKLIKMVSDQTEGVIFILWGRNAQDKIKLINTKKHHIIKGTHPSPLSASRGFFGCRHFSKCNEILQSINKDPINW